jgi:hypothetical protein
VQSEFDAALPLQARLGRKIRLMRKNEIRNAGLIVDDGKRRWRQSQSAADTFLARFVRDIPDAVAGDVGPPHPVDFFAPLAGQQQQFNNITEQAGVGVPDNLQLGIGQHPGSLALGRWDAPHVPGKRRHVGIVTALHPTGD